MDFPLPVYPDGRTVPFPMIRTPSMPFAQFINVHQHDQVVHKTLVVLGNHLVWAPTIVVEDSWL